MFSHSRVDIKNMRKKMIIIPKKAEEQTQQAQPLVAVGAKEAARLLSISERSLWTLTKDGKIHAARVGRKLLYSVDELKRFVSGK